MICCISVPMKLTLLFYRGLSLVSVSEPVRLVGGAGRCAGTLEVQVEEWGPVSGSNWTLNSANKACSELDCGSAVSTRTREESSLKSAWEISSSCVRSGYTLRECVTSGPSSSALEITCSGKPIAWQSCEVDSAAQVEEELQL